VKTAELVLSHSQVDAFSQCPLKWSAGYRMRLSPPERPARLAIGSAWHKVMEFYRKWWAESGDPLHGVQGAQLAANNIVDLVPAAVVDDEIVERMHWMLEGYIERWVETGEDSRWHIMDVEVRFDVPLIEDVSFIGYVDFVKIEKATGRTVIGDTKTTSGKDISKAYYSEDLAFEPQFARYIAAMRRFGVEVDGFEWDAARTDRLKRAMTLEERYGRVHDWTNDAAAERAWSELEVLAGVMLETARGERPVYANPISWVCKARCDFFAGHKLATETGRDFEQACLDYGYVKKEQRGTT